ncbi:unnamed protein product [Symbiodinium natans]|uniref:Uncharacterized protein n=1 Tax=Symbiodinium natans TaxID=878477 RepID=A0A812I3Q0_9DINO|nr:unnamed protein product [Symbiodinium natans]
MATTKADYLVIGAGPAGLAAAGFIAKASSPTAPSTPSSSSVSLHKVLRCPSPQRRRQAEARSGQILDTFYCRALHSDPSSCSPLWPDTVGRHSFRQVLGEPEISARLGAEFLARTLLRDVTDQDLEQLLQADRSGR